MQPLSAGKYKTCCATATRTISRSQFAARAREITARLFLSTAELSWTSRAWIKSKPFSPMASPFANRACGWASSKTKRANGLGASLLSFHDRQSFSRRFSRRRIRRHRLGRQRKSRDFNTVRAIEVVTMEPRASAGLSRRRSRPRNSPCLGHQRRHHAHLARARSRRGLVAMRRGL